MTCYLVSWLKSLLPLLLSSQSCVLLKLSPHLFRLLIGRHGEASTRKGKGKGRESESDKEGRQVWIFFSRKQDGVSASVHDAQISHLNSGDGRESLGECSSSIFGSRVDSHRLQVAVLLRHYSRRFQ
ncbi:hypothetical protein ACFX2B_009167 [Malus domestica]